MSGFSAWLNDVILIPKSFHLRQQSEYPVSSDDCTHMAYAETRGSGVTGFRVLEGFNGEEGGQEGGAAGKPV